MDDKNELRGFKTSRTTQFKDRLREAMKGESNYSLAKRVNMSDKVIRDYLNGLTTPTLDRAKRLSEALDCPFEWLATGYEHPKQAKNENALYDALVSISELCIKEITNMTIGEFKLTNEWLVKEGLSNEKLAIFAMNGDSMEPTISDKDIILVSISDEANDGIFVVMLNNTLLVKRLQYDPIRQGYHVKSDNPSYENYFVNLDNGMNFKIVAKVERALIKLK